MKKSIVAFLCVFSFGFLFQNAYSQKLHLELKNITTNKVRKLFENDILTVHTTYRKYKGALKIIDKTMISINGKKIRIEDIIKIEKKE
ncbi:MAG: hypothetical protein KDD26_09190 [Winogradskyella sp.]|nr:hypothetical protein [Winogradskyella sp.]